MDDALRILIEQFDALWRTAELWWRNMLLPSRVLQIVLILVVLAAAWILRRLTTEPMRDWMRGLDRPTWQIRMLLVVNRRLQLIWFVVLAWAVTWILRAIYVFPSKYYIVDMAATLGSAWLGVIFAARLVRNPILRTVVRWGLWVWVTLYLLGLTDETTAFLDRLALGFGEVRLSLLTLIKAVVIVAVLFVVARFLSRASGDRIRRNEDISPSMRVLAVKVLQIALYGAALFLGLEAVGVDLAGLAFLSGAIGLGLGFGLQKVVSNLVSGVIILLDKSIKPGDVISLGQTFGWVHTLGARYASITTRDGKEFLIPNEDLITGQVVNWSHSDPFVRLDIHFGCAYADDPHLVRRIAVEAAQGVPRVLSARAPVCHIVGFGDSSVDYILRFWITDPTGGLTNIRGNVFLALWDAFRAHGISIPFPQREVRMLGEDAVAVAKD
ncbi:mechanosensitive ion channel domain-containing protein [Oceaniovalibus guishaninsula]